MKRTRNLILSLLLTAVIAALCAVGFTAAAKESAVIAQGFCGAEGDGTNITWTLTDDWTVTFSGAGEMADYPEGTVPWDDAITRHVLNEMGYTTDEAAAQAMERLETVFDPDLYIEYFTAYVEARSNLRLRYENGITVISGDGMDLSRQTTLTLPASVTGIKNRYAAHDIADLIVYNSGEVTGLEVPAYVKGALHPQSAEERDAIDEVAGAAYLLGNFLSYGVDSIVSDLASMYNMTPEEIEENYDRLTYLAVAYYAANTGDEATTVEELYAAWMERINHGLGTDFTVNDVYPASVDENGNTVFSVGEAFNNAVIARFGHPANVVFNLGGDDYSLHSESVDKIGTEFEVAPWFTIHAPAGSATEAMALEKGIPFAAIPACQVSEAHTVTWHDAVSAAATVLGHTSGWYCEDCGKWLSGETIAPEAKAWGCCGAGENRENVIWTLSVDGTLTVSGTGEMDLNSDAPALLYTEAVERVIVEEGITIIDTCSFAGMQMKSIVIPASVTNVWNSAFMNCGRLETLTVLNPDLTLSTSYGNLPYWDYGEGPVIRYDVTLRGFLGSTTAALAADHGVGWPFIALCPEDYNHSVIRADGSPATCSEAGHTEGWRCEDCSIWLDGEETLPLAHSNAYEVAASLPTAVVHGHEAGVYCPDCDTWLSGHEVIHNQLGSREVIKEATVDEEGEVYIVCTVCGETGLYAIPKLEPSDPPTQPDEPEEPDDGGMNIVERIRAFAKSIVDWLLRLIRWIGKR